jgi:4-alpha-glucanotransferase
MTGGRAEPDDVSVGGPGDLRLAHGIEPDALGYDGVVRPIPESTLAALVDLLGPDVPDQLPAGIDDVLAAPVGARCYMPPEFSDARLWGITCQLPSLVSERNCGIGDFADLAAFCHIAAEAGADFVGVNPLHALFWSDPTRASPFFPSNRRFLNPIYIALEWIDGFAGLSEEQGVGVRRAKGNDTIDLATVTEVKRTVLRRLFDETTPDDHFRHFCEEGGGPLADHALFEAISQAMVGEGRGASPKDWPRDLQRRRSKVVSAFARSHQRDIEFHCWLQWLAHLQLRHAQDEAAAAGLRIGLYLDFAVGSAPDGSAAWSAPGITMPDISIGAPPDPFSTLGQDWGLAPLSPSELARSRAEPYAADLAAVARYAGAVRIDHAMSLARLWMIPRGALASAGAYVRNPLADMLDRVAEVSQHSQTLVIGEDLGVVPPGFRDILAARAIHRYIVYFFERWDGNFSDPSWWPRDALACLGTHDMPSFAAWWAGVDIALTHALGLYGQVDIETVFTERERDRKLLRKHLAMPDAEVAELSLRLHREIAASPCRLAVLQIEDALGLATRVNMPGTITEYPNWRRKLPVPLERLADDPSFRRHTDVMRSARPR